MFDVCVKILVTSRYMYFTQVESPASSWVSSPYTAAVACTVRYTVLVELEVERVYGTPIYTLMGIHYTYSIQGRHFMERRIFFISVLVSADLY